MFLHILRLESRKTFQRPLFWGSLLCLSLFLIFFSSMFFLFRVGLPLSLLTWPQSLIYALNTAIGYTSWTSYGTYFLILLIGIVTTQEYTWRTIQLWFGHGVSRLALLSAKFVLVILSALAIALTCLLVQGILTIFFSLQTSGSVDIRDVNTLQLILSLLRTTYSMLPYAFLTLLLAVVSRSAVVAVGGGLAFIAIGETILTNLLPLFGHTCAILAQYLPANLAITLNSQNYALANIVPPTHILQPGIVATIVAITLYVLLFGAISVVIMKRQDLT